MPLPVQGAYVEMAFSPAARTATFGSAVTSGNSVFCYVFSPSGQALPDSVVTNESDTLSLVGQYESTPQSSSRLSLYVAHNVTSGPTQVIATWGGNGNRGIYAFEVAGLAGTNEAISTGTGTSSPLSMSRGDAGNALHIGLIRFNVATTSITPSGGSAVPSIFGETPEAAIFKLAEGATTLDSAYTNASNNWDGLACSFPLAGASGATLTTPTATSITQTTATVGCTSDTATGLVHAGVTTTATPPSDAQLIAGSGGGLVAAGSVSAVAGANTVELDGLTANTGYFRHFIQSDGGAATSTMFSPDATAGFTTLSDVLTITSVTPSTVAAATNPVIAGTNFGAVQAGGSVIVSPTNNSADVNAVTQTITSWSTTSITLNGVTFPAGTAHEGTLYLFVFNDDQLVNAGGYTIAAYIAPLLTNPTQISVGSTTVTPRVTTNVNNGTAYYVIFPQDQTDPTKEQIAAGNGDDDLAAAFAGNMTVNAAGVLTFPEVTDLNPATAYRIGYTHNGDPNA